MELLQSIVHVEQRVRRLREMSARRRQTLGRREGPRTTRAEAARLKRQINSAEIRIEDYGHLLLAFRQIGDGIAFQCMDKWDIKPLAFKQAAGFVSGKVGLDAEVRFLSQLLSEGRTAILNDLTTCLRHGDITEVVEGSPSIYEVTSSKTSSSRKHRQAANAATVLEFIRTDSASGLYGRPHKTVRTALHSEEQHHRNLLNQLVDRARLGGSAWAEPERGLRYWVQASECASVDALADVGPDSMACVVNEWKYATLAHLPFPLLWTSSATLCDWYEGKFVVIMIVDLRVVREGLALSDLLLEQREHDEYPLWIVKRSPGVTGVQMGVGWHLYSRLFTECMSLGWLIRELAHRHSTIQAMADIDDKGFRAADGHAPMGASSEKPRSTA